MDGEQIIEVEFPDQVMVRRTNTPPSFRHSFLTKERGLRFGAYYVIQNTSSDRVWDPANNFDVGHTTSGLKVIGGLTFWEARRVALALDDADLFIPTQLSEVVDHDFHRIIESIIAAALMDHYVYPIQNYLCGDERSPGQGIRSADSAVAN